MSGKIRPNVAAALQTITWGNRELMSIATIRSTALVVADELDRGADLLAGVERLVIAYKAMLTDPETGAAGVDATVRQMATMAGIEVGA